MACLAFDLGDVVGMRVVLDVGVAGVAPEAAVNAGPKLLPVDGDAVARCILHGLVTVAGQAIRLREQNARRRDKQEHPCTKKNCTGRMGGLDLAVQPLATADKNCNKESCDLRGLSHAAVYFPQAA